MKSLLFLLLTAACLQSAEPSITGPTQVEPYKIVRLTAKDLPDKSGKLWKVKPVAPNVGAVDWASKKNAVTAEWVAPPGVYSVELSFGSVGADGSLLLDAIDYTVTIGTPPPAPTPVPPAPTPIPVTDPLWSPVKAAFDADQSVLKQGDALALAAGYRALVDRGLTSVKLCKDFGLLIQSTRKALIVDRLPGVRDLFGIELNKYLPVNPDAVMTDADVQTLGKQLIRFATILEALK